MNAEIKEKWIKALESGDYKQGTGCLKDGDGFCCLGVLADLMVEDKASVGWSRGYLPRDLREAAGLAPTKESMLITLNDSDLKTFPEIAAWIKENL